MAKTYSKSKAAPVYDNFLEALRDLGRGTVDEAVGQAKKMVTTDIPEAFGLNSAGTLEPNKSVSVAAQIEQAEKRGEQKAERQYERQLQDMVQAERARLLREESQSKQQIKEIQAEIKKLALSVGTFAQEVETAAIQNAVKPGKYHRHFFLQLKSLIVSLNRKVQQSNEWLQMSNGRKSKQGFYWKQVGSSGTKYMLSSERYTVTSTG